MCHIHARSARGNESEQFPGDRKDVAPAGAWLAIFNEAASGGDRNGVPLGGGDVAAFKI